jgi:hypothetical protein
VAAAITYNLFPYFPCRHLGTALERAGERHAASVHAVDQRAEHDAFRHGRESVVSLVRRAQADATSRLHALAAELDAPVRDLAAHRLREVDRRLRAAEAAPAEGWYS